MYKQNASGERTAADRPPKTKELSFRGSTVEAPERLAKLIIIALQFRDRIEKHLAEVNLDFDRRVDIIKGMNCHKVALFARGDISFEHLTLHSDVRDENGFPEVMDLANRNPENIVYSHEDIEQFLSARSETGPLTLHALAYKNGELHPAHSFVYVGTDKEGRKVCFHKTGPNMDQPFEMTTLEEVTKEFENLPIVYLVVPFDDSEAPPAAA